MIVRHGRGPAARTRRSRACSELLAARDSTPCSSARGAPKGKELELPGPRTTTRPTSTSASPGSSRWPSATSTRSASACSSSASATRRWIAAARSLRLGAKDVKVMARKPRGFFKASDWELEDAEEESVEIVVNHAPKAFVIEDGALKGMMFEQHGVRDRRERRHHGRRASLDEEFFPADDVILAIGQENAFPWIERDIGIEFDKWNVPKVDKTTFQSTRARRVLRRRCRVRPEEHHLGGGARPPGRDLDPQVLPGRADRPSACRRGMNLQQPQDGHARVGVQERLQRRRAAADAARRAHGALQEAQHRGRARLHRRAGRAARCSAASTATCRPCSARSCASSATPASTSARSTASPSRRNGDGAGAAHAPQGAGDEPAAGAVRLGAAAADRRASWSRTRMCACIAASAPSAARPPPGTCRNPRIKIPLRRAMRTRACMPEA